MPRRGSDHTGAGLAGLEQRVLGSWRSFAPAMPDGPLVVGFSGGPDSLALALCLASLRTRIRRDVELLHVDHGIRDESRTEANAARRLATELDLPATVVTIEPGALGRHSGAGLEEAARRERYATAARFVADRGGVFVTAHHADDQAETILLHLLRGSGLHGAGGMAPLTTMPVPWWPQAVAAELPRLLTVWRPLLAERRRALHEYLRRRAPSLVAVTDPSNTDQAFRRNLLRLRVLPALEAAFPGVVPALGRFGDLAREDDAYLDDLAVSHLGVCTTSDGGLDLTRVRKVPAPLRRRVIRAWISDVPSIEVSLDRVDAIVSAIDSGRGGVTIQIGNHWVASTGSGVLRIDRTLPPSTAVG